MARPQAWRVNRTLGDGGMEEKGLKDENVKSAASLPCLGKRKACKACRFRLGCRETGQC